MAMLIWTYVSLLCCVIVPARSILSASCSNTLCDLDYCVCNASCSRVTCDCGGWNKGHVTLRPDGDFSLPLSTSSLLVQHCQSLVVNAMTLSGLPGLRKVEIANVSNVTVQEKGFLWNKRNKTEPGVEMSIRNVTISDLSSYAIAGRYDAIVLESVRMIVVKPFAVSSLVQLERLILRKCDIDLLESQAFKKFEVQNMYLVDSRVDNIQSRAIFELQVRNEARFQDLKIGAIRNQALVLHGPRSFRFDNNVVGLFAGGAIQLNASGPVFFQNNIVGKLETGALVNIQPDIGTYRKLTFDNNTFERVENGSLAFNKRYAPEKDLQISNIFLDQPCFCHCFSQVAGEVSHAVKNKSMSPLVTLLARATSCRQDTQRYIRLEDFQKKCDAKPDNTPLIIGLAVGTVLLVSLLILVVILCRKRARKRRLGVRKVELQDKIAMAKDRSPSRYMMVVPDTKTYRETEVHVIVEKAEPLQHEESFSLQEYEDDEDETAIKY